MLSRLILGCAVLLPASLVAEDLATVDNRIARVVEHYNGMMKAKEWDAAEALALGARQMFSDNDVLLHLLVENARKANGKRKYPELDEPKAKKPIVDDSIVMARTYNIANLNIWNSDHTTINERSLKLLATKGMSPGELKNVEMATILKNKEVIVIANASLHAKISDNLRLHTNSK